MPFGRKKDDAGGAGAGADDSSRKALFGNRKGGGGGGGGGNNPYAQGPGPGDDIYAQTGPPPNAYQRAKQDASVRQPPPSGGLPSGPRGGAGGLPSGPRGGAGGLPSGPRGGGGGLPGGPGPRKSANPYGDAPKSGNPYGGSGGGGDRYGGGGGGGGGGGREDRYGGGGGGGDRHGRGGDDDRSGGGGYGSNQYGGRSGYGGGGGDRYGTGSSSRGGDRYGGGGGGGGGGRYGDGDDTSRDALFSGAEDRYAKRDKEGGSGGYGASYGGSYGDEGGDESGYGRPQRDPNRQLTAEEAEEEAVQDTKDEIRGMKREDVSSTRNALRIAAMAEESGRDTLARLGQQGEHIHNTEKNLDLAHNQNRAAEERAKELKTLNKSMFAVHVSNPFTAGKRQQGRDQAVLDKHADERERREATRRAALDSDKRMQRAFGDLDADGDGPRSLPPRNQAERAKYQFEADSEDEDMENEIEDNLDLLQGAAGRLHKLARATGQEVDEQITHLDRIAGKSDKVDSGLAANQARLDRFK